MSGWVAHIYRVVKAICKEIIAQASIKASHNTIRINKSSDLGVVIAALEIIKAGVRIVIIAAVAEGIERRDGTAPNAIRLGGKGIAPGIVGIGNHPVAIRVINGNDISLRIGAIIEDRTFHTAGIGGGEQLKHGRTAGGVVEIAQIKGERVAVVNQFPVDLAALGLIFVADVSHGLSGADAIRIVGIGNSRARLGIGQQPPPLEGERGSPVRGGIANGVIADAFPAHRGQQIFEGAVSIGVGNVLQRRAADRSGGIGIFAPCGEIAGVGIGIKLCKGNAGFIVFDIFSCQLPDFIIEIGGKGEKGAVRGGLSDFGDVPGVVVGIGVEHRDLLAVDLFGLLQLPELAGGGLPVSFVSVQGILIGVLRAEAVAVGVFQFGNAQPPEAVIGIVGIIGVPVSDADQLS